MPQSSRHVSLPELAGSWPITNIGGSPSVMPNTTEANATILGVVREPADGYDVDSSSFFVWVDGTRYTASFAYGGAKLPLSEVVSQINSSTGLSLATDDNGFVRLTSPTSGDGSSLRLEHNIGSPKEDVLYRLGFFPETFAYSGDIRQAQHVDPERQVALPGQMFMAEGESLTPGVFNRALFQLALNNDRNEGLLSRKQITSDEEIPTHAYSSPGSPEGYQFSGDKYVFVGDTVTPTEAELEKLAAVLDAEGREFVKEVTTVDTAAIPTLIVSDASTAWEAVNATSGTPFLAVHATGNYYLVSTEFTGAAAVLNGVPLKIVQRQSATRVLIAAVDPATGDRIDLQPSTPNMDLVTVIPYRAKVTGIYDSQGGSRVEGVNISKRSGVVPVRVERNNRIWVGTSSFTSSPAVEIGDLVHWSGLSGQEPFSNNGTYRVIAIPDRHTLELANEDWSSAFLNSDLSGGAGTFDVESDGLFYKDPFFQFSADGAPEAGDQIQILYRGRSTIREVTDDPTALARSRLFDQEVDDTVQKAILKIYGPSAETIDDVIYGDVRINLETINFRFSTEHEDEDGRHTYITCYDVLPRQGGLYDSGSAVRQWNEVFTEKLSIDEQNGPESSVGSGWPYKVLGSFHKNTNQTADETAHAFVSEITARTGGPWNSTALNAAAQISSSVVVDELTSIKSEASAIGSGTATWGVAYGGACKIGALATGSLTNAAVFYAYDGDAGSGDIDKYYGLKIDAITAGTHTNCGIFITGPSGGSTNNYSIWVNSGDCRFDSDVAIGYGGGTPPSRRLHVRPQSTAEDSVLIQSPATGSTGHAGIEFQTTQSPGVAAAIRMYHDSDDRDLAFFTSTDRTTLSEVMRLRHNGRVGIGTILPDQLLHLVSDADTTLRMTSEEDLQPYPSGTQTLCDIEYEGLATSKYNLAARIRVRQDGTWSTGSDYLSPGAIEFFTQDNSLGDAMTNPRMTIGSSGIVSIARGHSTAANTNTLFVAHEGLSPAPTSVISHSGIYVQSTANYSAVNSGRVVGVMSVVEKEDAYVHDPGVFHGFHSTMTKRGTPGGSVSAARGYYSTADVDSFNISTFAHFYAEDVSVSGGGVVGLQYGLYIGALNAASGNRGIHVANVQLNRTTVEEFANAFYSHTTVSTPAVDKTNIHARYTAENVSGTIPNVYNFESYIRKDDAGNLTGARGFSSRVDTISGGTGTIGSVHHFHVEDAVAAGGGITYQTGLFIEAMTGATTDNVGIYVTGASGGSGNNYAIWAAGGLSRFNNVTVDGYTNVTGNVTTSANFRATTSRILTTYMVDAAVLKFNGEQVSNHSFHNEDFVILGFYDTTETAVAKKMLNLPVSGTVTAARIQLRGGSTHSIRITLYKKSRSTSLESTATQMGIYETSSVDIGSSAWKSLTISSGAFSTDEAVQLCIYNRTTGEELEVGCVELTVTPDDVTAVTL